MVNVTQIPPILEPLSNFIIGIMNVLKVLVGGIFGIYVILVFLRWIEYKRMTKILKDIRKEIRDLILTSWRKRKTF